ncbi:YicC/YloC family endoribonuclease [Aestuariivirga litoralis]|uniref:YicC/YloC family endoribonuclease n=1 Tax=Aestuariivirga litoralis TaxID=2650924 RepID=UPI0018C6BC58|nr:YicC/YloC family endoribonuclease [Aestuariivirga litoralis]MBG1232032.1 YicC family protein [Aestuariivirga litoralis]
MAISSMTGFARDAGSLGEASWTWEIKSVNGKTLDARLRLPIGFDQIDAPARAALNQTFKRGNLQVTLDVQRKDDAGGISINREILAQYVAIAREIETQHGSPAPRAELLLALKGVIETKGATVDEASQQALDKALLASFGKAVAALDAARRAEGQSLSAVMAGQLDGIEALHKAATNNPARTPEAIRARLKDQVAALMDVAKFDEQRLTQEAVMLATKADIKEELDRLQVHIAAARTLLKSTEPVGRKFDFLAQEFNREANTLCSKANDSSLTAIGLDLKTVIDQMREQVQNIE